MRNVQKRWKQAAVLGLSLSLFLGQAVYAGTWRQGAAPNESRWWWDNEDGAGSYAANSWQWIDGNGDGIAESYRFDEAGWLYTNTAVDGYQVNEAGAWVDANGTVMTRTTEGLPSQNIHYASYGTQQNGGAGTGGNGSSAGQNGTGWVADGAFWKYQDKDGFLVNNWLELKKARYYFDEEGHMLTGLNEIDGSIYYFREDGSLQTKTFQQDGIWYVMDEDGAIYDEVDSDEWAVYRSENGIDNSTVDYSYGSQGNGSFILDPETDRDYYLTANGINDMKIVCALLEANGVDESALNEQERKVYSTAKSFIKRKKLNELGDYEKVVEITKYIWQKTKYEKDSKWCYTPYGALVRGKSVCEGYARAFKLLCNAVGISCYLQDGWVGGTGHAWNRVLIDGEWYLIDVTESKKGFDADMAGSMLFNDEIADTGFTIRVGSRIIFPNYRYYQAADSSEFPSADGTAYVDESAIRLLD